MKKLAALLLVAVLGGCATAQPIDPVKLQEANAPLNCHGKEQCDLYWQRSQAWIAQNSRYRIQTATDTVITTFGPLDSSADLAYQITKIPGGDGNANIIITAGCDNIFGCFPEQWEGILLFKRFVLMK